MTTIAIHNPTGFGFEELEFHVHGLIEGAGTLLEVPKDHNKKLASPLQQACFFVGATKADTIQRVFLHFVEKNKDLLAEHIAKNGNPYKIDLDAISESLWHAPIGFECFFALQNDPCFDQHEYNKCAQSVEKFIATGVKMTEEISGQYDWLWERVRKADTLMPLTSAIFPSENPETLLVLRNFDYTLIKRDEHDSLISFVQEAIEHLSETTIHNNFVQVN